MLNYIGLHYNKNKKKILHNNLPIALKIHKRS